MERNVICTASPLSINKFTFIALSMLGELVGNFKRLIRITTGTKMSDQKATSLKLALMPPDPLSHKGARGSRKSENPLSPMVGEGWPEAGVRGLIFPVTE